MNEKYNDFTKRLIAFSVRTLRFAEKLKARRMLWSIVDQLIRSATSIGANIVEAKASSSRREYLNFFQIALKSANETRYWLIVIRESDPSLDLEIQPLLIETEELIKIIGSSVLTMKKRAS